MNDLAEDRDTDTAAGAYVAAFAPERGAIAASRVLDHRQERGPAGPA
ncbi:hypothetical protein [Marilutibacter chinensis]|uniref:Uncharacterized protein n=1 Tax=Marilutibacter chinensis TaxID=2912247 RepID=A0ABS9HV80_9GAMM|nr:hypothetical protein [Lysobacter chinensis]MCF7222401.1 hypothetical protein [Lysobacter chinensis]